jgi:hypothetical protein
VKEAVPDMVCRENPASSIAIALARAGSWLDDAQVQSIVHQLRHEFDGHAPPPGWDRATFVNQELERARHHIEANPNFRPDRRAGLRNRLSRAHEQTGNLRDDILWAMSRLTDGVRTSQAALEGRLGEIAGQRGMSLREARAEFLTLRAQAPSGRQPRVNADEQRDLGAMPSDPATRHALRVMRDSDPVLPPVRLVQQWIPVAGEGESTISQIGISTLSDRVEVRRRDGSLAAYQAPRSEIDRFVQSSFQRPLDQHAAGRLERAANRVSRAEETAYAVRCDECGQFVGDRWHDCPGRGPVAVVALQDHIDGQSRLSAPEPRRVAELLAANAGRQVQAPVRYRTSEADVEGVVLLRPGADVVRGLDRTTRQRVDLDDAALSELECHACHAQDCRHVMQTREAVRDLYLRGAGPLPREEVSAALHALGVTVQARPAPHTDPVAAAATSFLSNPEAFRQAIRDTGPDRTVPFHPEDALQGYASDTPFGVEIEFNATTASARGRIAQELYDQGILTSPNQQGYHAAGRGGYPSWVFERDGSVGAGGELVTPILSDHPEAWAQLGTVCSVIRRHGGTTDLAGSHTNISSAGYTPEMAWRLVHLVRANEDDMFRMGRTRGSQRLSGYNQPFPRDPGPRWADTYTAQRTQGARETMVNFYQAFSSSGRIEFRFPDASHDPGVIQAQVNLCAAMTNYVRDHDVPTGEYRPLHTARQQGWARNLMAAPTQAFAEHTEPVRRLIDTLFTTDRDRRQIAALWGHGSYYR